jgi:hypothetical protein
MTHLDPDRLADRALGTDDPLSDRCPHCHCQCRHLPAFRRGREPA